MKKNKNIVMGVTASIALYKACDVIRRLREKGFIVTVVMTQEAEELIKPIVFQGLSGNRVYRGLFEETAAWEIEHVSLAERADVVAVVPATANCIGKIAVGICDDLLTCIVCATKAPVLLCPAMNEGMYHNAIVQANIKKLQALGYVFVEPKKGRLACGKIGTGCLAEIDDIVRQIERLAT